MIILGVDPGIAIVGAGVVEKRGSSYKALYYGAVTTKAHTPIEERLGIIYDRVTEILAQYNPDAIAVEELFFNNNVTTAFSVGQARGVILLAALKANVSVFEYTPLQVKQALTGYGRADKNQIQQMTRALLSLPSVPRPDDAADALAIALCHGNSVAMASAAAKFGGKS
ncbi:MAG: crossover junction endodeoxyribonuclease RuvC [Clostridia bacterium]|nr:crossover junction endodeoxyribonuclease RuvC [Clostridia bacterium]